MKASLIRSLFVALSLALVLAVGFAYTVVGEMAALALGAGFILFSLNFVLLARIYSGLLVVSQNGANARQIRVGLLFGSALKFLGLVAALYLILIHFKLSGLYVAAGSLLSLIVLTALLLNSYVKSFESVSRS